MQVNKYVLPLEGGKGPTVSNAIEAGVRRRKGLQWSFDMSVDLRLLTVMTRLGPGGNGMCRHVRPDIPFRDQARRRLNCTV